MKKLFTTAALLLPIVFFSTGAYGQTCDQSQPPGCLCIYFCTFTTSESNCNVTLNWRTMTEPSSGQNSFKIWRSNDGANWILIATVNGSNGGGNPPMDYSFIDYTPYNPSHSYLLYYIDLMDVDGNKISTTSVRSRSTNCTGSWGNLCGTPTMNGFSSTLTLGNSMNLYLTGAAEQPVNWSSSNASVATVTTSGQVTAVGPGTAVITGTYVVCGSSVSQTVTVPSPPYTIYPNPCNGITTTTVMNGYAGDVVVLRLSFGGYLSWNSMNNGTGATISLSAANQTGSTATQHYYGSSGFNLSKDITFTMPSNSVTITTSATVHNSTTMHSSTGTLQVISVNGISKSGQGVVCGGNSQGSW